MERTATAYWYAGADDLLRVARQHLQVEGFRPGQQELVEAVLQGRDALGILPTGGGKSLVYQLASLFLAKPVVVVSPLLALMRDQESKLPGFDVPGVRLDSTLGAAESREALARVGRGHCDLLFVTPEALRRAEVRQALAAQGVALFVVDEAHCVSSWGHDFRPAYLALGNAFEALGRPPVLALTATATRAVAEDVCSVLGLREPVRVRTSCVRPNLALHVRRTPSEDVKREALVQLLDAHAGECGIVYTNTVKRTEELWAWLCTKRHAEVGRYHGELPDDVRIATQGAFMDGRYRVMVATKAFGMGIDKADVRLVVHDAFPDSLESYVQEAGRAGRDGDAAQAVLLYRLEDRKVQDYFLRNKFASRAEIERVLAAIDAPDIAAAARVGKRKVEALRPNLGLGLEVLVAAQDALRTVSRARLRGMMAYGERVECRWSQVLRHFDEEAGNECSRCDVCAES